MAPSKDYKGVYDEVDTIDFDVGQWSHNALTQRTLGELTSMNQQLAEEHTRFDHEAHQLVYTNYSNFAAGTKLISGLKDEIAGTDDELRLLEDSIQQNHAEVARLTQQSKTGFEEVDRLVAITSTLNGIQLLLELPHRLRSCLKYGNLTVGVRLWVRGRGVLEQHKDVPSLYAIRKQCRPYVARITSELWTRLERPDLQLEDLSESVDCLRKLGLTKDGLHAELRARLMGKVVAKLDAFPAKKRGEGDLDLESSAHDLVRSMRAAQVPEADIVRSALKVLSPRLAVVAADAVRGVLQSTDEDELADCAIGIATELARVVVNGLDGLETPSAEHFTRETLNKHIATAIVGDAFEAASAVPQVGSTWARRRKMAQEVLVRAKVAHYLADPACAETGGLDDIPDGCVLRDVGASLLRRFAGLECQCIDHGTRWVLRQWARGAHPSLGLRVTGMLTETSVKLSGPFMEQNERNDMLKDIQLHAMRSVLEVLRGELVRDLEMYRHLKTEVRRIGRYLMSSRLTENVVGRWEDEVGAVLKARCAVDDDDINEYEGDIAIDENDADRVDPAQTDGLGAQPQRGLPDTWTKDRLVGRCSFGDVVLGIRPDGSEDIVKVLELKRALPPAQLKELMDEITALKRLRHRCLAQLYGCRYDGTAHELHIFTEYLQGSTLGSIVRRSTHRMPEVDAVFYVADVASGLSYLHAKGIVHSDVKGDNIFVESRTGQVKITDFAVSAKQLQGAQGGASRGTPLWMAPEMITKNESTPSGDVWSFGILTCEVLGSGKVPWPKFESTGHALTTIGGWSESLPSNVPQGISNAARDFLKCCLNPSKNLRWNIHALLWHQWLRPYHRAEGLRGFMSSDKHLHKRTVTPAEYSTRSQHLDGAGPYPLHAYLVTASHVLPSTGYHYAALLPTETGRDNMAVRAMRPLLVALWAAAPATGLEFGLDTSEPADALCAKPAQRARCALAGSKAGELLRLLRTDMATNEERAVARSYDGHAWEALEPAPADMVCAAGGGCTFEWDPAAGYEYRVRRVVVTQPRGTKHQTAKLLAQGTFGARKRDIDRFDFRGGGDATAAGEWFDLQTNRPALLAREYLRARNNPRPYGVAGDVYEPCEAGARWHLYAFTRADKGKQVEVVAGAGGTLSVRLDGVPVTEVAAGDFAVGAGTYWVCEVTERERLRGKVELGAAANCGKKTAVENPPVVFAAVPGEVAVFDVRSASDATFASLADVGVRDVVVTTTVDAGGCAAALAGRRWNETHVYVKHDFRLYRYDARMKLYRNTVEAPTAVGVEEAWTGKCPVAPMDASNVAQCDGLSRCGVNGRRCGSRGEVANDPTKGNMYHKYAMRQQRPDPMEDLDFPYEGTDNSKTNVFHNIVLKEEDHQLRYRVAWALYQIIPVNVLNVGKGEETELWVHYMDIFAANAFGNYRDILWDVAHSPIMGLFLTFTDNKAYAASGKLPDQNFAREIMQLFTIGLYKLHINGTSVLDAAGNKIQTYGVPDIVTYARAWTGFRRVGPRGNMEGADGNYVDPMQITPGDRDVFPKTDLDGGYIGDGYPLCEDLPAKHFLKAGARYVLAGEASVEGEEFDGRAGPGYEDYTPGNVELVIDGPAKCQGWTRCGNPNNTRNPTYEVAIKKTEWITTGASASEVYLHGDNGSVLRIRLVSRFSDRGTMLHFEPFNAYTPFAEWPKYVAEFNYLFPPGTRVNVSNAPVVGQSPAILEHYTPRARSPLYRALCGGPVGQCVRSPEVRLDADLACETGDAACEALEHMGTVKVASAGQTLYYTYVQPACVSMAVFEGRVVSENSRWTDPEKQQQCANPRLSSAGAACCRTNYEGEARVVAADWKPAQCAVVGERMPFATAAARCAARGLVVCEGFGGETTYASSCGHRLATWMDRTCTFDLQVTTVTGDVALVAAPGMAWDARFVNGTENKNTFFPAWAAGEYPHEAGGDCVAEATERLVCKASVVRVAVFAARPGRAEVARDLRVGAWPPGMFGAGTYRCAEGVDCDGDEVAVWVRGPGYVYDADTIVGVRTAAARGGGYRYYANRVEEVHVEGVQKFKFRNAPTFMPFAGTQAVHQWAPAQGPLRVAGKHAAAHETEALLDHLFYHGNMAPFVAHLMIQRLVTSNPSPRYVEAAARAFTTGFYGARGSGRYGCMKAMLAAIMLDREARSSTLDADPGHGVSREPILKVWQVLRAMDAQTSDGREFPLSGLGMIGQDVFQAPSVFGFFLPTYKPNGPLYDAGLVSPEVQLLIAPRLFSLMDRLGSLFRKGLCRDSFSYADCRYGRDGGLNFDPLEGSNDFPSRVHNSRIVDELDLALTDGRLSDESKKIVMAEMHEWNPPFDVDLAACPKGYHVEKRCDCSNVAACNKGDICRADKGWWWQPVAGCVRGNKDSNDPVIPDMACCSRPDAARARKFNLATAQQLMTIMPEFHTTNLRMPDTANKRVVTPLKDPKGGLGYKAVVGIAMHGGCDSYSHLVPGDQSKCGKNGEAVSYQQYQQRRGNVAIPEANLKKITPKNGHAQPCSEFYVNGNLSAVAQAFEDGHGAWFANVGNLVMPVTRHHRRKRQGKIFPPFLFAHNYQTQQSQTVHAQDLSAKGVLGRMAEAFDSVGRTNIYSLDTYQKVAQAKKQPATILSQRAGAVNLAAYKTYEGAIDKLLEMPSGSYFADTYQDVIQVSVGISKELQGMLYEQQVNGTRYATFPGSSIGRQLDVVSQIMRLRREDGSHLADRDVFAVSTGGFDSHNSAVPGPTLEIDNAIAAFREEMEKQGMWEDVVVVSYSDFGRTMNSNGKGTDHAWAGNYFAVGGSIRDQTMLSTFVESLDEDGHDLDWGRGIVIPKWGYEVYWGPIMDWFGVEKARWYEVLPNLHHFPPICKYDLFDAEPGANTTCDMPPPPAGTPAPAVDGTPAPAVVLAPLGDFEAVCGYVAVEGMPVEEFGYTVGLVDGEEAVRFRVAVRGGWAGVGLRSMGVVHAGMNELDITTVDTEGAGGARVQDYDVTFFASAPDASDFTQSRVASHASRGGREEVEFYRLLRNGVDHTIALGYEVDVAVAAGAGSTTGSMWQMHSAKAHRAVVFESCDALRSAVPPTAAPGTPSTDMPASMDTRVPSTEVPTLEPEETRMPATDAPLGSTGAPDGSGDGAGGNATRTVATPAPAGNGLGAAGDEEDEGSFPWIIIAAAVGAVLLCAALAAFFYMRRPKRTAFNEPGLLGETVIAESEMVSPVAGLTPRYEGSAGSHTPPQATLGDNLMRAPSNECDALRLSAVSKLSSPSPQNASGLLSRGPSELQNYYPNANNDILSIAAPEGTPAPDTSGKATFGLLEAMGSQRSVTGSSMAKPAGSRESTASGASMGLDGRRTQTTRDDPLLLVPTAKQQQGAALLSAPSNNTMNLASRSASEVESSMML